MYSSKSNPLGEIWKMFKVIWFTSFSPSKATFHWREGGGCQKFETNFDDLPLAQFSRSGRLNFLLKLSGLLPRQPFYRIISLFCVIWGKTFFWKKIEQSRTFFQYFTFDEIDIEVLWSYKPVESYRNKHPLLQNADISLKFGHETVRPIVTCGGQRWHCPLPKAISNRFPLVIFVLFFSFFSLPYLSFKQVWENLHKF